jgi:hypothetical protein
MRDIISLQFLGFVLLDDLAYIGNLLITDVCRLPWAADVLSEVTFCCNLCTEQAIVESPI